MRCTYGTMSFIVEIAVSILALSSAASDGWDMRLPIWVLFSGIGVVVAESLLWYANSLGFLIPTSSNFWTETLPAILAIGTSTISCQVSLRKGLMEFRKKYR